MRSVAKSIEAITKVGFPIFRGTYHLFLISHSSFLVLWMNGRSKKLGADFGEGPIME